MYIYIYVLSHEYQRGQTQHSQGTGAADEGVSTLTFFMPKSMRLQRVCSNHRGVCEEGPNCVS